MKDTRETINLLNTAIGLLKNASATIDKVASELPLNEYYDARYDLLHAHERDICARIPELIRLLNIMKAE